MEVSTHKTVTIANGETTSGAIDLGSETLVGVYIPAAFTGSTISFTDSPTLGGTYVPVMDGLGNVYSRTVSTSDKIPLDPAIMASVRNVRIVSGSSEGGARVINLATRQIA